MVYKIPLRDLFEVIPSEVTLVYISEGINPNDTSKLVKALEGIGKRIQIVSKRPEEGYHIDLRNIKIVD